MGDDEFRKRLEEIFLSDEQEDTEEMVREKLDAENSIAPGGDRTLVSD